MMGCWEGDRRDREPYKSLTRALSPTRESPTYAVILWTLWVELKVTLVKAAADSTSTTRLCTGFVELCEHVVSGCL